VAAAAALRQAPGFLLQVALTLLGLLAVTFFIGRVVPIDPVLAVVGDQAPRDVYEAVRRELGLDQPLWVQFGPLRAEDGDRRFRPVAG
jgi:ABC-type dipeptide/oligopeptide/nickel transport system permease component